MNNATDQAYTFGTASLEIFTLFALAFILGALVCYTLKLAGICCRRKGLHLETVTHVVEPMLALPRPFEPTANLYQREEPLEADLRTLLRGRSADEPAVTTTIELPTRDSGSFQERVASSLAAARTAPVAPATTTRTVVEPVWGNEGGVDDLKKLEGIGPRIEAILNAAGIHSYVKLATMDRDSLKAILEQAGPAFAVHEPKSWPYQAELAAKQNWERLKEYQDFLQAGRVPD